MNWRHCDEWKRDGRGFRITVVRWTADIDPLDPGKGPHRWAVYAYIYPGHPLFRSSSGSRLFQDAAISLPLHGGPSPVRLPLMRPRPQAHQPGVVPLVRQHPRGDAAVNEPRCRVCNVPLIEHLGHEGQCDRLQRLSAAARDLIAVCRDILHDGETDEARSRLAWRVHCCEVYAHAPSKVAVVEGGDDA
jgi:hypothetical protein